MISPYFIPRFAFDYLCLLKRKAQMANKHRLWMFIMVINSLPFHWVSKYMKNHSSMPISLDQKPQGPTLQFVSASGWFYVKSLLINNVYLSSTCNSLNYPYIQFTLSQGLWWYMGGREAEWLELQIWYLYVPGWNPVLTTILCCSR